MIPETAPSVAVELLLGGEKIALWCLSRVPSVGERIDGRYVVTVVDHVPQVPEPYRPDARVHVERVPA